MVATQVKWRRGTESQNNAFTGAEGEITVDTTQDELRVHDGLKPGGFIVAGAASIQRGRFNTATVSGTDTLTCSLIPALSGGYPSNFRIRIKTVNTNTGSVSLNVNGQGAITLKKISGVALVDLGPGDLPAGCFFDLDFDGTYLQVSGLAQPAAIGPTFNGPVSLAGQPNGIITGLSGAKQIDLDFYGVGSSGANILGIRMGNGALNATNIYRGSPAVAANPNATNNYGGNLSFNIASAPFVGSVKFRLIDPSDGTWVYSGNLWKGDLYTFAGRVTIASIDRVGIIANQSNGTGLFNSGEMSLSWQ